MKLRIRITEESFYVFFSFLYFSISNLSRMLMLIGIRREISYIVFAIFFIVFVIKTIYRIRLIDIIILLVIWIPTIIGLIKYHTYVESATSVYATVLLFLPAYYYFRMCDMKYITKGFEKTIYFASIYLLFDYFTRVRLNYNYNMAYAYWIIVPICGLMYRYFKYRRIIDILLSIICFITLVISGSRGALVVCVACVFFFYIVDNSMSKNNIYKWGAFLCVAIIVYLNIDSILDYLSKYSDVSRNIKKLVTGQFLISNNRNTLQSICSNLIDLNKWGYGSLASRQLIVGYPYPHSVYYELQLDYGVYIGTMVLAIIIGMAVYILFKNKRNEFILICGIVSIVGLISLFFSSTYYQEYTIPAIIALFMNSCYQNPKHVAEIKEKS